MNWPIEDAGTVFRAPSTHLLLATVLVPGVLLILGVVSAIGADPVTTRALLSSLAGIQASVIAVVFAVTALGVQLIATRYTPRLITLFSRAPILRFTLGLFAFSIGLDLFLLYFAAEIPARLHTGLIYAAAGLAVTTTVALYEFIQLALQRGTPEGIIIAFAARLTPERYAHQVERMTKGGSTDLHPLHPLYSMIMSALSNRERATAEAGIQHYGDLAQEALTWCIDENCFSTRSDRYPRDLFEPVLNDQLPRIVSNTSTSGELELARDASEIQQELGTVGLRAADHVVTKQAVSGIRSVLLEAPTTLQGQSLQHYAWTNLCALLTEICDNGEPETATFALSMVGKEIEGELRQDQINETEIVDGVFLLDIWHTLIEAQQLLLDQHEAAISEQNEWEWQNSLISESSSESAVTALDRWRRTYIGLTEQLIRQVDATDQSPLPYANIASGWMQVCTRASQGPTQEYAIALCQVMIETAYIAVATFDDPDTLQYWADELARVKLNSSSNTVDRAFENILSYEYEREPPGPLTVDEIEDREETYYQNFIDIDSYSPLNTDSNFPDVIRDLREEFEQRTRRLADKE